MSAQYGVRLIGGEMSTWSDTVRPGGHALRDLAGRTIHPSARVLVAGPHQELLVDFLVARQASVTCLVRSLPDAQDLGRRHADSPSFSVLCGALDQAASLGPFDAIIAAGGLSRLASADSSPSTWAENRDLLTAMLLPGGVLMLGIANPLGVQRLVETERSGLDPWAAEDPTVPGSPAGSGFDDATCYGVFPTLEAPTLLLPAAMLAGRVTDVRSVLVSSALTDAGHVLSDPRRLAADALALGRGMEFAPGWLVVTSCPAASSGLVCDEEGDWSASWELRFGQVWERSAVTPATSHAVGRVSRDRARLSGVVPAGIPWEELLRTACATADLPALRRSLRAYASWLEGQAVDGMLPGHLVFATARNVLAHSAGFALLDASWSLAEPLELRLVLAQVFADFTRRLLTGGYRHPWPTTLDQDGIALTMLAMAGHPGDRGLLLRAAALTAEISAAREGLGPVEEARLFAALAAGEPLQVLGYRDALQARRRLAEELADARARAEWLDDALQAKEKTYQNDLQAVRAEKAELKEQLKLTRTQLRTIRTQLRRVRGSRSFRIGRLVTAPARLARPRR